MQGWEKCVRITCKAYDEWLEEEDNNDRMVSLFLLTKWFGNAWDHVCAKMDLDRLTVKAAPGSAKDLSNQKDIRWQGLEEEYIFSLDDAGVGGLGN